jgi:hypothetical protein
VTGFACRRQKIGDLVGRIAVPIPWLQIVADLDGPTQPADHAIVTVAKVGLQGGDGIEAKQPFVHVMGELA